MAPTRRSPEQRDAQKLRSILKKSSPAVVVGRPNAELTMQRFELISDFLEKALKQKGKYGGRGAGRALWHQELLDTLNRSGRGEITHEDMYRWLKQKHLAKLVVELEGSIRSISHDVRLPAFKQAINCFLENTTKRPLEYAVDAAKVHWKKDLLQELNHRSCAEYGQVFTARDLDRLLQQDEFKPSVEAFERALDNVKPPQENAVAATVSEGGNASASVSQSPARDGNAYVWVPRNIQEMRKLEEAFYRQVMKQGYPVDNAAAFTTIRQNFYKCVQKKNKDLFLAAFPQNVNPPAQPRGEVREQEE